MATEPGGGFVKIAPPRTRLAPEPGPDGGGGQARADQSQAARPIMAERVLRRIRPR